MHPPIIGGGERSLVCDHPQICEICGNAVKKWPRQSPENGTSREPKALAPRPRGGRAPPEVEFRHRLASCISVNARTIVPGPQKHGHEEKIRKSILSPNPDDVETKTPSRRMICPCVSPLCCVLLRVHSFLRSARTQDFASHGYDASTSGYLGAVRP